MATVIKRGDLQWQCKVRVKGYPPRSKTFTLKMDAERWGRETEVAIERGIFFDRTKAEQTTVQNLIDRYRSEVLPEKRGKHFAPALRVLEREFGKFSVAALSAEQIAKFRKARLEVVQPGTVRKELVILSSLLDQASKEWGIPIQANPCASVKKPVEQKGRDRRLHDGEEDALLKAAGESVQLRVLIILALETAARLGELLGLKWELVNLQKRTIHFLMTKNGEARIVPLSKRAVAALAELKLHSIHISGRVFFNWSAADSFNKTWKRKCEKAEISNLHFHDLRHEACSRLAPLFQVQELMKVTGHKTVGMVLRYYHPRAEELAKKLG